MGKPAHPRILVAPTHQTSKHAQRAEANSNWLEALQPNEIFTFSSQPRSSPGPTGVTTKNCSQWCGASIVVRFQGIRSDPDTWITLKYGWSADRNEAFSVLQMNCMKKTEGFSNPSHPCMYSLYSSYLPRDNDFDMILSRSQEK